jgi:hypothetical protein
MRLDEEKLEALRSWGERLREAGGEESAAVGRAILMLVEEIDRLHVDIWHARMELRQRELAPADKATAAEETVPTPELDREEPVTSSLQVRLQRVLRRNSRSAGAEPVEQAEPESDAGTETSSPQAWIDALRRQK